MDAPYTGNGPSIQWGGIHLVLIATPRISIQWAVIAKYAFIHFECHRLHIKASFTSFQLLSLLNLLINSTCKLDISESIYCASQQNCNTSLHYNNSNHMSTTIKIVADKENKTVQWKEEIRTTLEETRKQHLQNEFSTSMVITYLPKFGALGVQASRLSHERNGFAPCGMECSQ